MSFPDDDVGSIAKVSREQVAGLARRIELWLTRKLPQYARMRVRSIGTSASGGLSGETFIVSLEGDGPASVVVKKDVREKSTNPQSSFSNLIQLQTTLSRQTSLPVPKVLGIEATSDVIGAPFMVMEYVPGDIPSDVPSYAATGWVHAASAAQRRAMWTSGIDFLVRLHSQDWRQLSLGALRFEAAGADDLERCLNHSIELFRVEACGRTAPVCERAIEWLRTNRPRPGRECINWGDARIGNIIWRDFQCAAVIDWEMGSLGHPGIDLGWWSFFHRWSTHGHGLPDLNGFCSGEALADLYETRGGERIESFRYYEVLAAIRGLSIWLRTYEAMKSEGAFASLDPLGNSIHMIRVLDSLMSEAS